MFLLDKRSRTEKVTAYILSLATHDVVKEHFGIAGIVGEPGQGYFR